MTVNLPLRNRLQGGNVKIDKSKKLEVFNPLATSGGLRWDGRKEKKVICSPEKTSGPACIEKFALGKQDNSDEFALGHHLPDVNKITQANFLKN